MTLAYDVGVFDGADTAHYLKLGYRVIGIEASPDLCKKLQQQFAEDIAAGRYVLLNVAIGERDGEILPFWISENQQWNSFNYAEAAREGKKATQISVPTRTVASIFREYGVPDLLKVDIEGYDHIAVHGMGEASPRYVSFEAHREHCDAVLLDLSSRGYTQFSLVQQQVMRPVMIPSAGSLAHVQWSVRQWLRWQLRKLSWIHDVLAGARSGLRWGKKRRAHRDDPSSVPMLRPTLMPTEHADGWYSTAEFMWLWRNVIASGMIESSWYDVHAIRAVPEPR